MSAFGQLIERLSSEPRFWLVTGVAGFIGSHLLESLLRLNQLVVGLDNYATGSRGNLDEVRDRVGPDCWRRFLKIDGDIRDPRACKRACHGVDYVLHQAGLGSVPRSLANPDDSQATNVTGFLNMLVAARDNGVKRFVYASSSAVYGDHPVSPKVETALGQCVSPYAVTNRANELYAEVFARCYGLETIGLRYFNVFGPRQDAEGPYAAVIPRWVAAMIRNEPIRINGDGKTSRDFCYVANVVQANLLAATAQNKQAINQVYNVALCARTTLNELFGHLRDNLLPWHPDLQTCRPHYGDFRPGDVRHSEANITKAMRLLGYRPSHTVEQGLAEALDWYRQRLARPESKVQSLKSKVERPKAKATGHESPVIKHPLLVMNRPSPVTL
jgi:UDP-N-acetylglucosamine 4-epimerase